MIKLAESDREKIPIFRVGQPVDTEKGTFTPDDKFIAQFIESFNAYYEDRSYRPPILREHRPEGINFGKVEGVSVENGVAFADVQWAEGMMDLRKKGIIAEFSPSFHKEYKDPHSDNKFPLLMRELSIVAVPQLKNLPTPENHFYALFESNADVVEPKPFTFTFNEEPQMADEEKDMMQKLSDRMDAIESQLAEMTEDEDVEEQDEHEDEEEEQTEDEEKPVENSEASDTLQALRDQNKALLNRIKGFEDQALRQELGEKISDLDDETFEQLVSLKETNTDLYEKTVVTLSATEPTESKPKGKTGNPAKPGSVTVSLSEAKAKAIEMGLKGAEKVTYLQEQGVLK